MSFIFKITTTTSPQTFVIPCVDEGTFNATVDYGDGTGSQTVTAYNDSNLTHSFATAGQYTITIDGTFPNVKFYDNVVSREALDEVVDLGDVGWVTFFRAFRDCTNLTTFNSGTADTSSVSNMIQMFYGCTNLTTLELSGFATSSVTTMQAMFNNCSSLTTLDLSSFDTSSVSNMIQMFYGCTNLTTLELSGFATSSVTTMQAMFNNCSSLTTLDLSSFDTSSVTAMQGMFLSCSSLTSLNVSNFDTSSVNNMQSMFNNCSSLTTLDIKHFDISSVTNGTSFLQNANNALTTTQYDELLEAWAAQEVQPNVPWHFGNAQYTVETIADWYSPRNLASLSIINNKLVSIADGTAVFGAAQQVDNLIVGNVYKIIGKASCSNISANVIFRVSGSSNIFNPIIFETSALGNVTVNTTFTATATTMYIGTLVTGHAANDTVTIDAGITVKEITNYTEANAASEIEYSQENVFGAEEVVNGDFANGSSGWTDLEVVNGYARVNSARSGSQSLTLTNGKTYRLTLDINAKGVSPSFNITNSTMSTVTASGGDVFKTYSVFFTVVSTGLSNISLSNGSQTALWDNISIKEITNAVEYKNIPQSARELYSLEDDTWTDAAGNTIEVADFIEPVTQGMTLTEAWTNRGTAYSTLGNTTSASVRVDATISNTDDGILMEAGGTGEGVILYVYNSVLYFQCGSGSAYGTASNRAEVSYTLPVGESDYIIECSADTSNAVLYVNGLVVGSQAFSESKLAGSDGGTLGEVQGLVAVNRGGWTTDGAGVYTNTITKCDVFDNQITSDV